MGAPTQHELVGRSFRSPLGGRPLVVVDVDDRFVYVKRADESKRSLANPAGAQIVAVSEFGEWREVA